MCAVGGRDLNRKPMRWPIALNGDAPVDATRPQVLENKIGALLANELKLRQVLREELDDWALGIHERRVGLTQSSAAALSDRSEAVCYTPLSWQTFNR